MNNIHPFLSSFPVVLIVCSVFLEIVALLRHTERFQLVISVNLLLATAFSLLAFISGYQARDLASQTFEISEDVILWHHYWGRSLLFILLATLVFRFFMQRTKSASSHFAMRSLYFLALILALAVVLYTGYLGGELVFSHGAGVSAPLAN